MPNIYNRTTGNDTTGADWTNAKTTIASGIAAAVAGDNIFLDSTNTFTAASNVTYTFPGIATNPVKVVSVNASANPVPPTAALNGAIIEATGAVTMFIYGTAHFQGITFRNAVGSNSSAATLRLGSDTNVQKFQDCLFHKASTGPSFFDIGSSSANIEGEVELINSNIQYGQSGQKLRLYMKFRWNGGALTGVQTTTLVGVSSMGCDAQFTGVDLSNMLSTANLIETGMTAYGKITFRNCKLPAAWTGNLFAGDPVHAGFRAVMHNCSYGATFIHQREEDMAGRMDRVDNIFKTGGATSAGTPHSWKITTKPGASYPAVPFKTAELPAKWNSTVGSPITVNVDVLVDSGADFTNADMWLEVQYQGATDAKSSFVSSIKASVVAAATAVPTSTADWTAPGVAAPRKQRLSVTFTPQRAGFIQGHVSVAKANATLYINPRFD